VTPRPPRVSVNLCCYNSEKYLDETLQSVISQTFTDWELVVVDDGSTDSTAAIIRAYIERGYPIRYIYQQNTGLGQARNTALDLSNGTYVAFVDHDDVWAPDKLARQVAVFEATPELSVVYSQCRLIDEHGRFIDRRPFPTVLCGGSMFEAILLQQCIPPWLTVMVRTSALREVAPFLPYGVVEDFDILLKLAHRGSFDYVDAPLASYRIHANQFSRKHDVKLNEGLAVLDEWVGRTEYDHQRHGRMFRLARAQMFFEAGAAAMLRAGTQGEARRYFVRSWHLSRSSRPLIYWGLTWISRTWKRLRQERS